MSVISVCVVHRTITVSQLGCVDVCVCVCVCVCIGQRELAAALCWAGVGGSVMAAFP